MIGCLILSLILIVLFLITLLGLNLISMLTFALLLAGTGGIYYFLISRSLKKSKEPAAPPKAAKKPESKPAAAPKPVPNPPPAEPQTETAKEDAARWAPKIPLAAGPQADSAPGAAAGKEPLPPKTEPPNLEPASMAPSTPAQPETATPATAKSEPPAPVEPAPEAQPIAQARPAETPQQPEPEPEPPAPAPVEPAPEAQPIAQTQPAETPQQPEPASEPPAPAHAESAPTAALPQPAASGSEPISVKLGKQLAVVREQAFSAAVNALQAYNKRQKQAGKKIAISNQTPAAQAETVLTAWQFLIVQAYLIQYPHLTAAVGRDFLDKLKSQVLGPQPDQGADWLQRLAAIKPGAPAAACVAHEIAAAVAGSTASGKADEIVAQAFHTFADKVTLEAAKALGDRRTVTKLTNLLAKSKS